jgi:hypothetical protein
MEIAMVIAEVVDYAPHVEELKNLIRDVHEQANERNLKEAEETALRLLVEAKLLLNAIRSAQMKPVVWSYSSLDLFKMCPHKYFRLKVKKDVKEPYQDHLQYGLKVHKAAENFIEKDTPIPHEYEDMLEPIIKLKDMRGEKLCEYRMGLTRNLEPCKFSDKEVWWRGIADLIVSSRRQGICGGLQNKQVFQVCRHEAVGDSVACVVQTLPKS